MTVFVVTDGTYSEYSIEKIFNTRAAAEEYALWHNIQNEIEEYELLDSAIETTGTRYYVVELIGHLLKDGHWIFQDPRITRNTTCSTYNVTQVTPAQSNTSNALEVCKIRLLRYIHESVFNENQIIEKMKKASYDIYAEFTYYREMGMNVGDINTLLTRNRDVSEELI